MGYRRKHDGERGVSASDARVALRSVAAPAAYRRGHETGFAGAEKHPWSVDGGRAPAELRGQCDSCAGGGTDRSFGTGRCTYTAVESGTGGKRGIWAEAVRPRFGALPRYATVVSTRRPPLLASQRVIDARELSVAPRRRSADDLLRMVPGVLLSQHGAEGKGQQIFLRGFDAAHGIRRRGAGRGDPGQRAVEHPRAGVPRPQLHDPRGGAPDLRQQGAVSDPAGQLRQRWHDPLRARRRARTPAAPASATSSAARSATAASSCTRPGASVATASSRSRRCRTRASRRAARRSASPASTRSAWSAARPTGPSICSAPAITRRFGSPGALAASDVADGRVPATACIRTTAAGVRCAR